MNRKTEQAFLVPNALILDDSLSFTARRLGAVLYSFGTEDLQLTLSTLANMTGSSITTIRGNLQDLEATGYIQRQKRIRFNTKPIHLVLPSSPETCTPIPCSTLSLQLQASSFCVFLYLCYMGCGPGAEGRPSRRTIQRTLFISDSGVQRSLKEIRTALEEKKM